MELGCMPWNDPGAPGEGILRACFEDEGFGVHAWRDPADRIYSEHSHDCDESLWVVRGQIVFEVSGREFPLGPGDRLLLPAGVAHRARAGPDGARYLIGRASSAIQSSIDRPTRHS
jgi:mannose-6-phosphate isomerase-like protein (cupin superfamily)